MKILTGILVAAFCVPAFAADEDAVADETVYSTQTYADEGADAGQIMVQDSEEDTLNFVEDYIKKDIDLKGYFFIEEEGSKQPLKLKFSAMNQTVKSEDSGKTVTAKFKDAGGKIYEADFSVSGINWGNLDINKIKIRRVSAKKEEAPKTKPAAKQTGKAVKKKEAAKTK